MAALSNYLENKLIDWLLRGQSYTPPTAAYFALNTTNNNAANTSGVEVSGGNYSRVSVSASLANWAGTQGAGTTTASTGTSGQTSNNSNITFPTPSAAWGVITGFSVYDAATGGNLLFYGALTTSKTVNNGDPAPDFPSAAFAITFS